MSLFKIRDIWSLDLEELQRHSSGATSPDPQSGDIDRRAQFIAQTARFSSVGSQDVFVCGHLSGYLYIIQVPESDQRRHIKCPENEPDPKSMNAARTGSNLKQSSESGESRSSSFDDVSERQILAAHDLGAPLIDLKCGFFTSALKQSIAVLSHDRLFVFQVKRHRVDLMSAPNIGESDTSLATIDKNLLSHELELYVKLDLLPGQFAYKLLVLNSHADSCLVDYGHSSGQNFVETNLDSSLQATKDEVSEQGARFEKTSKRIVQQLHLPQRDKIIVQYADQFLLTLIDSKKVAGHFCLRTSPVSQAQDDESSPQKEELDRQERKLNQMERSIGYMPMAHLTSPANNASSLVISLSDFSVHSLPLNKLMSQAKQSVIKRVALNLLGAGARGKFDGQQDSTNRDASVELIQVDLADSSDWSRELLSLPLQMQGLRRQLRASAIASAGLQSQESQLATGSASQLLVMCRYSLDLFSCSGNHLWSQSFETPLVYLQAYTITSSDETNTTPSMSSPKSAGQAGIAETRVHNVDLSGQSHSDKIISLLCSDTLSDDKSNLIIMNNDLIKWSALLSSKPLQVFRLSLSQMQGLLGTLDLASGQLTVSYLGTNVDPDASPEYCDSDDASDDAEGTRHLIQLERIDETLVSGEEDGRNLATAAKDDLRKRLRVQNSLEAAASDGSVNVCTSVQLDPDTTLGVVVHNIVITFKFDDLLRFELQDGDGVASCPARGVAQLRLGSCWPDRREPMRIRATFGLRSSRPAHEFIGVAAIDNLSKRDNLGLSDHADWVHADAGVLPRSLRVTQLFDFNETHSGPLHQEESFVLPINMIAQLTHVDYSSGDGQELEDVLGNLGSYKRGADLSGPSLSCDLFLTLRCDFMSLVAEIIYGDFLCRDRPGSTSRGSGSVEHQLGRRAETLESINLLAQSLNCRLRFMSPTPGHNTAMTRQPSEELDQPVMVSFALKLRPNNLTGFGGASTEYSGRSTKLDDEQTIWIHVCDVSRAKRSKLVEDFIGQHVGGWKEYAKCNQLYCHDIEQQPTAFQAADPSIALISLECNQPLPIVLILDHLSERVRHLSTLDARLGVKVISGSEGTALDKRFFERLNRGDNQLAISSKLHDSLLNLIGTYNAVHRDVCKKLQSELVREYCKFQVMTRVLLSVEKRMPSLPEEMSIQATSLMLLLKDCHQRLSSILDELEHFKKRDYEYSKVPEASLLKIAASNEISSWTGFQKILD